MADEFDGSPDPKLLAPRTGVVVLNNDPEKLHRCRIKVPGIIDTMSGWALPIGALGGGGPRRGFFDVPPVGAEVVVFFIGGDVDNPRYIGGHWGRGEVPTDVQDGGVTPDDAPKVHAFETDEWQLTFDDRPGKKSARLRHKATEAVVEIDGTQGAVNIEAPFLVNIKATGQVAIQALSITLNGRPVGPGGPI